MGSQKLRWSLKESLLALFPSLHKVFLYVFIVCFPLFLLQSLPWLLIRVLIALYGWYSLRVLWCLYFVYVCRFSLVKVVISSVNHGLALSLLFALTVLMLMASSALYRIFLSSFFHASQILSCSSIRQLCIWQ